MNAIFRHVVVAGLLVPALAAAEESSPSTSGTAPSKIQLSAGLMYGIPQGDFKKAGDMDIVGASPGLALGGGYMVIPHLSVQAALHYLAVSSKINGVDLSSWDVGLGARYAYPVTPVVSAYGEGLVNRVSYSQSAGGQNVDASGIGFALGAGVQYAFKPHVSFGGGLSYSSADLDPGHGAPKQSSGWLSLNAFATYHL